MEIEELIEKLPPSEKRQWSYLETIRVSERETIMANLLAFYFDPEEKHGLGDIFIRALLQTRPLELRRNLGIDRPQEVVAMDNERFSWAKVIVEDSTDDNKRLDILVETEKSVIAIEFKINHDLNNPLNSYVRRIESKYPKSKYPEKVKYYVVLTPQWKEPVGAAEEPGTDFKQVILSHFIGKVDTLVKNEVKFTGDEGTRQLMHYNDFLSAIINKKIRINMINRYFDRVKSGNLSVDQIENAFKQFNELKGHAEKEMNKLLKLLNKKTIDDYSVLPVSKDKIESVARYKKGDKEIKVRLNLRGWAVERWRNEQAELKKAESVSYDIKVSMTELAQEIANEERLFFDAQV